MNKRNYQKELDEIIKNCCMVDADRGRPRLLLHACCAPCSSYCIEYLAEYFDITLLFYNPNIFPKEEYNKRAKELVKLVNEMEANGVYEKDRVKTVILEYDPDSFEEMSRGMEHLPEGAGRCYKCYRLRMEKAAEYAAKNGFDYFTTTLSISPLKNPVWINEIGEELGLEYNIRHLPSEFRKRGGYQRSIALSKEYDLYRQDFCGCRYSKIESDERKKRV